MGLDCFVCHVHFVNANNLVRHMRLIHGFYHGKALRLKCAQPGCRYVFGTFSGFRKHLYAQHGEQIEPKEESGDTVDSDVIGDSQLPINEEPPSVSQVLPVSDTSTPHKNIDM